MAEILNGERPRVPNEQINYTQADVSLLTGDQIAVLDPSVTNSMLTNNIISMFTPAQFQRLSADAMRQIITSGNFDKLTAGQIDSITPSQFLCNVPVIQILLSGPQNTYFQKLPPRLLKMIPDPWSGMIPKKTMTPAQLEVLSPDTVYDTSGVEAFYKGPASSNGEGYFKIISDITLSVADATSKLTADQIKSCKAVASIMFPYGNKAAASNACRDDLNKVPPIIISFMSSAQKEALTPGQLASLTPLQKAALSADQISIWQQILNWFKNLFGIKSSFGGNDKWGLLFFLVILFLFKKMSKKFK